MKTRFLFLFAGLLVCSSFARGQSTKVADAPAELFKTPQVLQLDILIGQKEMDSLRREDRKYVKATIKEGKTEYPDVGIHLRGSAGSFRGFDDKAGYTINSNKFKDEQLFHGLDKFHLCNSAQDPSYLSELICGEIMRAAGVPAARISHAVVKVNGKLKGFYYLKEGYDHGFIKRNFDNGDGNFYDGGFLRDIDQPLQLIHTKSDVKDHADLKALLAACGEKDINKRYEKFEKLLELDKFVSMLCLEVVMWDWDGYPLKPNNYRIYHDPKKDKITFIPSGMDQMYSDLNGPILPGFGGVVARSFMETPKGKEKYLARMEEIMKTCYKPKELVARLDEMQKVLQPAMKAIDVNAANDLPNQINRLKQAIPERAKSIEAQLKQMKKK